MKLSKHTHFIYMILIILINIGTLFFVAPLKENLSHLGNELGHKYYVILWGSSAAIYFYYYTLQLMKKTLYQHKLGKGLLLLACIFMALSVLLPYDPQTFFELSKWHTRIAMWGTILYAAVFFHLFYDMMKTNYSLFETYMPYYTMLVGFDTLFFVLNGVSTVVEISFVIVMSFLLYLMNKKACL